MQKHKLDLDALEVASFDTSTRVSRPATTAGLAAEVLVVWTGFGTGGGFGGGGSGSGW